MNKTSVRNILIAFWLLTPSVALAAGEIVLHRDPGCGCCVRWAAMVRKELGRPIKIVDDHRRAAFQQQLGLPKHLGSCHTAMIDGLAFEGHVPISDVKRLLAERPRGVTGLAVAGMPLGSPGMEVAGAKAQHYSVMAFGSAGEKLFARH